MKPLFYSWQEHTLIFYVVQVIWYSIKGDSKRRAPIQQLTTAGTTAGHNSGSENRFRFFQWLNARSPQDCLIAHLIRADNLQLNSMVNSSTYIRNHHNNSSVQQQTSLPWTTAVTGIQFPHNDGDLLLPWNRHLYVLWHQRAEESTSDQSRKKLSSSKASSGVTAGHLDLQDETIPPCCTSFSALTAPVTWR